MMDTYIGLEEPMAKKRPMYVVKFAQVGIYSKYFFCVPI